MGRIWIEERMASPVLISVALTWSGVTGHFRDGWLLAKQNRLNGAMLVDILDDGGGKDGVCCGWFCQMKKAVDMERYREEDAFLRDKLVEDDESKLMWLTILPLKPTFHGPLSVLSWWKAAFVLCGPCCGLATKVAWGASSCSAEFSFGPQLECILFQIYSDNPWMKVPLSTNSLNILWLFTILVHSTMTYSVGTIFDGWVNRVIYSPGPAILLSVAYVSSE